MYSVFQICIKIKNTMTKAELKENTVKRRSLYELIKRAFSSDNSLEILLNPVQ
jgi:hypothetical protein